MRAVCWCGKKSVKVETVPDPVILNPRDAIIQITSTAICGSDLHLYDGYIPTMEAGDILGHEFMGEVVEVGRGVQNLKKGDRVVVPFTISCGHCFFCRKQLWSACDNAHPNAAMAEKMYGFVPTGIYGYSHLMGGYAGGQAEYVRVPFADVGPLRVPDGISDDKLLFLTDIFPTGYQAAEACDLRGGETVAVFGCGPVGQFAIRSAFLLGAERVIGIDSYEERLQMARDGGAETVNLEDGDTVDRLTDMTAGRGPDACIDAVGLEAHGSTPDAVYDAVKTATYMATDRVHALRLAIMACRKAGTVSIPGVYGGFVDKFPLGIAFNKGLQLKLGQTHVQRYLQPLLDRILNGDIDPSFVITHRYRLDAAAEAYDTFQNKEDRCIKVVLDPQT